MNIASSLVDKTCVLEPEVERPCMLSTPLLTQATPIPAVGGKPVEILDIIKRRSRFNAWYEKPSCLLLRNATPAGL